MINPFAREADRLRVIIESLAYTDPGMPMSEAAPTIFAIEKRTVELEDAALDSKAIRMKTDPETLGKFIDIQPDIQAEGPHRTILAIKMLRQRVVDLDGKPLGLLEAKVAIQEWVKRAAYTPASPMTYVSPPAEEVADWIDTQEDIVELLDDHLLGKSSITKPRILAIKEARIRWPGAATLGLREAKEGVDEWLATRRPPV